MKSLIDKARSSLLRLVEGYPVVLGALVIYGYYLVISLDFFSRHREKTGLLAMFLQFDSLILLWGVVFALVELQKFHKEKKAQEQWHRDLYSAFERQRIALTSLDQICEMVNDRINNPLSIISLSASSLRRHWQTDDGLVHEIEKMEGGIKRVQEIMIGLESYHAKKIVKLSKGIMNDSLAEPNAGKATI
jgi:hypothetical protein